MLPETVLPETVLPETILTESLPSPIALGSACPGLFYTTPAQDGNLVRLRIPGGQVTVAQAQAIAQLADCFSAGILQITNRANVQIRTPQRLPADRLSQLQTLGLASSTVVTDHLRNIMLSPTAGIDPQALWDPRSLAQQWEQVLAAHPEWAGLSAKFSVGLDGGEAVSVRNRPNDVSLVATPAPINPNAIRLRLRLSQGTRGAVPQDVGVRLALNQALPTLTAIATIYSDYTRDAIAAGTATRPPRLRDMLQDWGLEAFLDAVNQHVPLSRCAVQSAPPPAARHYQHLGVHPQLQSGFFYVGIALPLGRLHSEQLRQLAQLSGQYGSGQLRLTPWQNLLLPNIPQAQRAVVAAAIARLGLPTSAAHPWGAIVACAGHGCQASATDTQADAFALAAELERCQQSGAIALPQPLNIHFSGCDKLCAQPEPADLTLIGTRQGDTEGYYPIISTAARGSSIISGTMNHEGIPEIYPSEMIVDAVKNWIKNRSGYI